MVTRYAIKLTDTGLFYVERGETWGTTAAASEATTFEFMTPAEATAIYCCGLPAGCYTIEPVEVERRRVPRVESRRAVEYCAYLGNPLLDPRD